MEGRRIPDGEYPEGAGEYSKHNINDEECWIATVPTGGSAVLLGRRNRDGSPYHWVEEHEDGTITVQPNPPDAPPERRNSNSIAWNDWHGYIRRGIWETC